MNASMARFSPMWQEDGTVCIFTHISVILYQEITIKQKGNKVLFSVSVRTRLSSSDLDKMVTTILHALSHNNLSPDESITEIFK